MPTLTPVILAGGSGTRLWPLSREDYPKQLLHLTGSNTLLQETVTRLDALAEDQAPGFDIQPPLIACAEDHRFLTLSQLEEINHPPQKIILEPCPRNTAPALTIAALTLFPPLPASGERAGVRGEKPTEDPIMLVMPADHVIADLPPFHRAVTTGAKIASTPQIVTFGIVPTHAETGFGYLHTGGALDKSPSDAHTLQAFVEKPDLATAESYLASGDYLWNSGMFMMRASVWLQAMATLRPDILSACRQAVEAGTTDGEFFRVDPEAFAACPSDSIDYAVMEKTDQAVVVPLDAGWSDVGSWSSLLEASESDEDGNALVGDVTAIDSRGCYIYSGSRLVATLGLEDHVVVETKDAVLVAPKDRVQDVKTVVEQLKAEGRYETSAHREVFRPWGSYDSVDQGERFQVKRLTVLPGAVLSLQMHHHRAEHWVVVSGTAKVTRGEEEFLLQENESTFIPLGVKHRIANPGKVLLHIIEVQSGSYLGEDDIVRFDDNYGRAGRTD